MKSDSRASSPTTSARLTTVFPISISVTAAIRITLTVVRPANFSTRVTGRIGSLPDTQTGLPDSVPNSTGGRSANRDLLAPSWIPSNLTISFSGKPWPFCILITVYAPNSLISLSRLIPSSIKNFLTLSLWSPEMMIFLSSMYPWHPNSWLADRLQKFQDFLVIVVGGQPLHDRQQTATVLFGPDDWLDN
jgi:hypothetical protein